MKNAALDAIPVYGSIRKYRRAKARWAREKEREAAALQARAELWTPCVFVTDFALTS